MIIVKDGKSHLVTKKELERHKNISPEERKVRFKIAHEKRYYENYEVIMRHRLEVGVITTDKFIRTMESLKQKRDNNIKEIEEFYRPVVRIKNGSYICYNKNFLKEYELVVHGMGNSPKEAYEDWKQEMIDYGYLGD